MMAQYPAYSAPKRVIRNRSESVVRVAVITDRDSTTCTFEDVPSLVLGPLLRHVTTTSATVWVETSDRCRVSVLGTSADTFTIEGHHFALVIIEQLEPSTRHEYDVRLDDVIVWPEPASPFPAPVIRTLGDDRRRILFGSCRATAPHEPPYSLELDHDSRAKGVDALRAHGLRMLRSPIEEWPDLMVFLGDQIYADDASPKTKRRIRRRRSADQPPKKIVAGFEEYTWLYREAWTPDVERWVLSVVPSTMVFDDHDMIDDWNISDRWVSDIRQEPWWQNHIVGGLMSYWIYQHLGNLSPERIREEGMLERFVDANDASAELRLWAMESERFTPVRGGYYFSFHREIGDVRLIVIDSRNGRVLDPDARQMVDDDEWAWISARASEPCRHLLIASSLPMLVPGGLHDLQRWSEALCSGRWGRSAGRVGERIRRGLDLEDWAAFDRSFRRLCDLLERIGTDHGDQMAPDTITLLSGDIHFAYVADASFGDSATVRSRIRQIVSSPLRNALSKRERRAIRFSLGRGGRSLGRFLGRRVGRRQSTLAWEISHGPFFANNVGMITIDTTSAHLLIERSRPDDDGAPILEAVVDTEL